MNDVIWKDIEGYEGLYQVSNMGEVKSLVGWNGKEYVSREKILKQSKGGTVPYLFVGLHKDKQVKQFNVHRLVAIAFIDNPENLPVVMHMDDNPENNHVDNLKWGTQEENTNTERHSKLLSEAASMRTGDKNSFYGKQHSLETKKKLSEAAKKRTGEHCPSSRKTICDGVVYHSVGLCAKHYGVPPSTMSAWLNNRNPMPEKFKEMGLRYYAELS